MMRYQSVQKRQHLQRSQIRQFDLGFQKIQSLENEKLEQLKQELMSTHRTIKLTHKIRSEAVSPEKRSSQLLKVSARSSKEEAKPSQILTKKGRKSINGASGQKIVIRSKGLSHEKYLKVDGRSSDKLNKQRNLTTPSSNLQQNLTKFQQQEVKKYPFYFKGERRITKKADFTDEEGTPIIKRGDSIAYRYEIMNQLGRGSFGIVFKALDHKKKQKIALKIIRNIPKLNTQSKVEVDILELILKEDPSSIAHLVKIKGSFVFRGHSCIVYELLFCNLYQYMRGNRFQTTPKLIINKIAIQILQALSFLKKHSIVHCDIKPENVMFREENKTGLKIIDVGSGCFESKQLYTYIQSRFYRAPEIFFGIRYTPAIDMWSFGCVLAELHKGFPLFPGKDEGDQMLMFMEFLGKPPIYLLEKAPRRKKFFDPYYECIIAQKKKRRSKSVEEILESEDKLFIDLIKRCLEWDPAHRITPEQALLHEWIIQGIPLNLRARHRMEVEAQMQKE